MANTTNQRLSLKDYLRYIVASVFVGFCLFPLYIVISTSLKSESDIFAWPPKWLFVPTFDNYYNALFVFGGTGVFSFLVNSLVITAISTILAVGLGAMVSYGLTRFRVPRRLAHILFHSVDSFRAAGSVRCAALSDDTADRPSRHMAGVDPDLHFYEFVAGGLDHARIL
jgi:ABC-type glycerol-3-phosphate transport system permease component